jgi:hypothetical protein
MTRDIHEFVERLKAGEVEEQEADLDKEPSCSVTARG